MHERFDHITCLRDRNNFFLINKDNFSSSVSKIHQYVRYQRYSGQVLFFFLNIQISICIRYHYEYSHFGFHCIFHFTIAFLRIEKMNTRHQGPFSRFFVKRN